MALLASQISRRTEYEELRRNEFMTKKIGMITQARMGSTRLPGKMMKKILGKSILSLFLERVRRMRTIDKFVVTTTRKKEDEVIVQAVQEFNNSVEIFRGSETDVLDRYYQAAKKFEISIIARITADCPFIDPEICDSVVKIFRLTECDFCTNDSSSLPLGLGVQVFSLETLEKTWKEAKLPKDREHVSTYIQAHPDKFRLKYIDSGLNLKPSRWTIDFLEDFKFVAEIYKRLYYKKKLFSTKDIIKVLEAEPELIQINAVPTRMQNEN